MNIPKIIAILLIAITAVEQYVRAQNTSLPVINIWVVSTANSIHHIELPSGKVIASIGSPQIYITDIALNSFGQLYGVDGGNSLYKINNKNAQATLIGKFDIGSRGEAMNSIEFRSDDILFGTSGWYLYRINTNTAETVAIMDFPNHSASPGYQSMAINQKGNVYLSGFWGGVLKIGSDLKSWIFTDTESWINDGLTYANDNLLYVFDNFFTDSLYTIDLSQNPGERIMRRVENTIYTRHDWAIRGTATNPRFYKPTELGVLNPTVVLPQVPGEPAKLSFGIQTKTDKVYVIESTETLTASVWAPVQWIAGDGKLKNFLQSIKDQAMQIFRIREIPQGFLSFPLEGKTAHNCLINSVFDHSMSDRFCPDNVVVAYTGEFGNIEYGSRYEVTLYCRQTNKNDLLSFRNKDKANFSVHNQYFGGGKQDYLAYDGHPGYDFKTNDKDPDGIINVLAAGPGKIIVANKEFGTIGIEHTNGFQTLYLHLSEFCLTNKAYSISEGTNLVGQIVSQGDVIGKSGGTDGNGEDMFPHHLHFEVRKKVGEEYVPVDPYGWESKDKDPYTIFTGIENANLWKE